MKVLLLCGSHPRHEFILRDLIIENSDIHFTALMMEREDLVPNFPKKDPAPTDRQKKLFYHHFSLRRKIEEERFGINDITIHGRKQNFSYKIIPKENIGSPMMHQELINLDADLCFVMGFGMLPRETLSLLPKDTINIHLGLSPKYRGSATLFWPTYFLDPFSTGVTFHRMNLQPDAGQIIHQCVPVFQKDFTLHTTAAESILRARQDLKRLFELMVSRNRIVSVEQPLVGKTFLVSDFRIAHLELIYEYYDDQVISSLWPQNNIVPVPKLRQQNFY